MPPKRFAASPEMKTDCNPPRCMVPLALNGRRSPWQRRANCCIIHPFRQCLFLSSLLTTKSNDWCRCVLHMHVFHLTLPFPFRFCLLWPPATNTSWLLHRTCSYLHGVVKCRRLFATDLGIWEVSVVNQALCQAFETKPIYTYTGYITPETKSNGVTRSSLHMLLRWSQQDCIVQQISKWFRISHGPKKHSFRKL